MVRGHSVIQIIGTIFCLVYAVIWVVAWLDPALALTLLLDPWRPRPTFMNVPPIWAALLFAAAPVMRHDTRSSQIVIAVGILVFIASGLADAARGAVAPADALFWLIPPLAIAAWVFGPPLSEAELAALPPRVRGPSPLSLGQTLVFGVGVIAVMPAAFAPPGGFIVNLGFGDIVVPRYAAIAFGLCCMAGAVVACGLGIRIRKRLYARAKPAIRIAPSPQGRAFQWRVIIDGQTVGTGERATEREARDAADALIERLNPPP